MTATADERVPRKKRKPMPYGTRKRVMRRDLFMCQKCGKRESDFDYKGGLQVHHIKAVFDGGADDESNLITLCALCHTPEWHHIFEPHRATFTYDDFMGMPPSRFVGVVMKKPEFAGETVEAIKQAWGTYMMLKRMEAEDAMEGNDEQAD